MVMDNAYIKLYQTQTHPCGYIDGNEAQSVFVDPDRQLSRSTLTYFSELGFRRSGDFIYRPNCSYCAECVSVRVPCRGFNPSRSHRRILKRNRDLSLRFTKPVYSEESYCLFARYIEQRHEGGDMYPPSVEMYRRFLLESCTETLFLEFRLDGRLIGVAVTDLLDNAFSAVYTYFDTSLDKRSLGTFSILQQIELAKRRGLHYLYLGYWVKDCRKMSYKINFRPLELLINQNWCLLR